MKTRKIITTVFSLTFAIQLSPVLHAQEDAALAAELIEVLKGRQEIYNKNPNAHQEVFEKMWVKDDNIVLVSEDFQQIFHGRQAVEAYFTPPKDLLYVYREQLSNGRATPIADGLVTVTYDLRYDIQPIGQYAMGGISHMSTIMKKTDQGWKIQAEMQLPKGLISQARVIQELAVSPDFENFARQQNPNYDELIKNDKKLKSRKQGVVPWQTGGTTQPTMQNKKEKNNE